MALGDNLLPVTTMPVDQAAEILRQPIQPPIDPSAYADAVDEAHFQQNVPNFFRAVQQRLAEAQAERESRAQEQAKAQAAAQAEAEQAAQSGEAARAAEREAVRAQVEQTPASAPPGQVTTASTEVPYYLARPEDAAAPAAPPLDIRQMQADAEGVPAPPVPPVTAADLTQTTYDNAPRADLTPEMRGEMARRAEEGFLAEQQAAAANGTGETNPVSNPGSPGGIEGYPDPGSYVHQVSTDLNKATEPLGELSQKAIEGTPGGMALKFGAEHLPEEVAGVPVKEPVNAARDMAEQAPGYIAADILTGGALTPLFGAQAAAGAADVGEKYQNGEISGKEALTNLALLSPALLPVVLHGYGKLSEFSRSPAGQKILASVKEQAAVRGPQLASESGQVKLGPGETDEGLPLYHGSNSKVHEARLNTEANVADVTDYPSRPAAQSMVQELRSLGADEVVDLGHPDIADFLSRPMDYTYAETSEAMRNAGMKPEDMTRVFRAGGLDGLRFPANTAHSAMNPGTGQAFEGGNIVVFNPEMAKVGGLQIDPKMFGTGEGSGMHGAGFYTTDNPDIAKFYAGHTFDQAGGVTGARGGEVSTVPLEEQKAAAVAMPEAPAPEAPTEAPAEAPAPAAEPAPNSPEGILRSQQEAAGVAAPPPDWAGRLNKDATKLKNVGEGDVAEAIDNLTAPDPDPAAAGAPPAGAATTPPAPPATPPAPAPGGRNPKAKPLPSAQTTRMSPVAKVVRETLRTIGIEHGDPKSLREIITTAARNRASSLAEADVAGRASEKIAADLGAGNHVLQDLHPNAALTAEEAAGIAADPDNAKVIALANPSHFDLTPEQQQFADRFHAMTDKIKARNEKAGVKFGEQTGDEFYVPRITIAADGRPVVTAASSFTRGRTIDTIGDYLAAGNKLVSDPALLEQAHMEGGALTRFRNEILTEAKKLKDLDGKGKPLWYGAVGGRDGYAPVDNMGSVDKFGRQWQARQGRVHELMTNTFSNGLPDIARLATAPSRLARSLQFMVGGFHAAFGNVALWGSDMPSMLRSIPDQLTKTATEAGRATARDENISMTLLGQHSGLQLSNVERFGRARKIIQQAQGVPEAESGIGKIPVLGKLSEANHNWLFQGVMPKVQGAAWEANVRWVLAHKPDLIPADFESVMAGKDTDAISKMLADNKPFKQALEKAAARANHAMGFTESTMGPGEKGLSQGIFNTPTITRSLAANVRDAFLPPGNIQGALARKWWATNIGTFGTIAVGGTMLAHGGDSEYTDPTSSKFILNPNSGKYFMAIVLPSGTTVSLLPAPVKTPLRTLLAPAVTAVSDIRAGESPQTTLAESGKAAAEGAGSFVQNRLARGLRVLPDVTTGVVNQEPSDLKAAGTEFATGAAPIVGSTSVQNPPTSLEDVKARGLESLGTATGAEIKEQTPFENYNGYLKAHGFPDGALTTPSPAFQSFLQTDPGAAAVKAEYDTHAREVATGDRAKSLAIQDERKQKIGEAQTIFDGNQNTNRYIQFRHQVTDIRALEAQRQADLHLASSPVSTPAEKTLESWYQTYDQAKNPLTGAIESDDTVDPTTGVVHLGSDSLQAAWRQEHPGEYESIVRPATETGLSSAENLLKKDRGVINDSGWWDVDTKAWDSLLAATKAAPPGAVNLSAYRNYADYETARRNDYQREAIQAGYTPDKALAIADLLWSRDKVASVYSKERSILRLRIEADNPKLVPILGRWGYSTTNPTEASLLTQE